MPINFSQPEPFNPAVTAGAAATEFAAKTFPTIAQLYENAARLRASGGGGGGGGGGGPVQSGGPVQVLGRDDYGALAQVEQQANRQQQAANLGAELQWDPVGRHITQQEDFRREQAATEQANQDRTLRLLNPQLFSGGQGAQVQPGPTPRPVQWTPEDQTQLNGAGQGLSDLTARMKNMEIPPQAYEMMKEPLQQQYDELTSKQQAAEEEKKQQAYKQAVSEQAHQRGLLDLDMRHAGENGYKQIPDLPTPIRAVDKHTGKIYTVNADEIKHVAEAQKDARALNSKLQLQREQQQTKLAEDSRKAESDYLKHYSEAVKHVQKVEEDFMKGGGKQKDGSVNFRERKTPEEFADNVSQWLESQGLPRSLQEFRGQRGGGPANSLGSPAGESNAPEPVKKFISIGDEIGRTENGGINLPKATDKQLSTLEQHLDEPDKIGMDPRIAASLKQRIAQIKASRPPAPAGSARATEERQRNAEQQGSWLERKRAAMQRAFVPNWMIGTPSEAPLPNQPYQPGAQVPLVPGG